MVNSPNKRPFAWINPLVPLRQTKLTLIKWARRPRLLSWLDITGLCSQLCRVTGSRMEDKKKKQGRGEHVGEQPQHKRWRSSEGDVTFWFIDSFLLSKITHTMGEKSEGLKPDSSGGSHTNDSRARPRALPPSQSPSFSILTEGFCRFPAADVTATAVTGATSPSAHQLTGQSETVTVPGVDGRVTLTKPLAFSGEASEFPLLPLAHRDYFLPCGRHRWRLL